MSSFGGIPFSRHFFIHLPGMKYIFLVLSIFIIYSCSNEGTYTKAADAQDAGREFIRASLDGDMKKAQFYLVQDSANQYIFNYFRDNYNKYTPEEKNAYRNATIRPIRIQPLDDSTVNYVYSNSYKPSDTTVLKVVKINGEWLIDLKSLRSKE
jgi:hypothetical protein